MRVRNLALACVAAVAIAVPARADIILSYHLSSFVPALPTTLIPANDPLGPSVGALNMTVGQTIFLQVAITGNNAAPYGAAQMNWDPGAGGGMSSFGFIFNYPASIVAQPYVAPPPTNPNRPNANAMLPYSVAHPNTFTGYNMGGTSIGGLDLGGGLAAAAGIIPTTNIAVFKLTATNPGSGTITLTDQNPSPTAGGFGLEDDTNLDPTIFSIAHNSFPLSINVAPIPEPSSMAFAGLALAGLGWRKLRRKKVAAA